MYEIPKPELLDPDRVTRDDREDFTPADHRSQAQLLGKALGDSCAYADQLWEAGGTPCARTCSTACRRTRGVPARTRPRPLRPPVRTTTTAWARWMNALRQHDLGAVRCPRRFRLRALARPRGGPGAAYRARPHAAGPPTGTRRTGAGGRRTAAGAGPSRDRTQDCLGRDRESSRRGRARCPRAARAATDTASSPHRGDPVGDVDHPRSARPDPARSAGTRRRMRSGRHRRHDRQPEARAGCAAQLRRACRLRREQPRRDRRDGGAAAHAPHPRRTFGALPAGPLGVRIGGGAPAIPSCASGCTAAREPPPCSTWPARPWR